MNADFGPIIVLAVVGYVLYKVFGDSSGGSSGSSSSSGDDPDYGGVGTWADDDAGCDDYGCGDGF